MTTTNTCITLEKNALNKTTCIGYCADEIWIQTLNIGDIDAFSTPDIFNYFINLSDYHLFPSQNQMLSQPTVSRLKICIGGSGNTETMFRRKNAGTVHVVSTPDILNCIEKRKMIMRWTFNGEITLLKETNVGIEVVMKWTDPSPIPINGVGIMTAWGADGLWTIEN
ncbi:unnamed protein product [Mytilus edulis]|uniref:Farnesoic acid O-methyl transferase domain-containing protein n=1 Tax=Mytilus edulis TaxID=6550 RepID=A0A8S3S128_MYTED|nr:unnamed protein product [Mytilus edulis]